MKFLIFTRPIEGIEKKLPHPQEFEAQIGWIREQLRSGRFDCAYHGENHAVAIVNAESREDLEQLYGTIPLLNSPTAELKRSGVSSIKCREFWKVCVGFIYAGVERTTCLIASLTVLMRQALRSSFWGWSIVSGPCRFSSRFAEPQGDRR